MIVEKLLLVMTALILLFTIVSDAQTDEHTIVQEQIQGAQSKFYVYIFVPLTAVAVLLIGFCLIKLARQQEGDEELV